VILEQSSEEADFFSWALIDNMYCEILITKSKDSGTGQ